MAVWKLWMLCAVSLLSKESCSVFNFDHCSTGILDVDENTDHLFTCGGYKAKDLNWTVYDRKGGLLYSGSCTEQACGAVNDQFILTAKKEDGSVYRSWLTMKKITRNSAYKIRCNTVYLARECTLRIIVPVRIVPHSCSVNILQWNVAGQCTLEWPTDQTMPNCTWHVHYKDTMQSFQGYTTDTHNSQDYKRINCPFMRKIPAEDGNYTYSISASSHPGDKFSKTFKIENPEEPKHNCPETVLEGSNINCTCYVSKIGNPPAQITWNGSKTEHFVIKNVTRKSSGIVGRCHQTWGDRSYTASYIVRVSYGPFSAHIERNTEISQGKRETVLICTATDVYPSAVFYWNITCENKTETINTSTCTSATEEEMIVECTAKNRYFDHVFSSSIYVLNAPRTIQHNTGSASAASFQGALTGGVVTAVLVIAVIVAVSIVYIRKRRKVLHNEQDYIASCYTMCRAGESGSERGVLGISPDVRIYLDGSTPLSTPYAVVNKPKTETPVERNAAPSGDLYTIACTMKANQGIYEYAVVCKTTENKRHKKESDGDNKSQVPSHEATTRKEVQKPTILPKPTIESKTKYRELSETTYVNVTELPTDSDLRVYHVVPCATNYGSSKLDTSVYAAAVVPDDEYDVLQFEKDRTGLEDQASHYNHLEQT